MITYKQGDLLQAFENGEINVIGHQTNTCCGCGAGIAKSIVNKYPIVSILDLGFRNSKNIEGKCLYIEISDNKHIFNLYAQKNVYYVSTETFETRIEWLHSALKDMKTYLDENDKIGIPLIGSGLAANRELKRTMTDLEYFKAYIASIVEEELKDLNVTVYYL